MFLAGGEIAVSFRIVIFLFCANFFKVTDCANYCKITAWGLLLKVARVNIDWVPKIHPQRSHFPVMPIIFALLRTPKKHRGSKI